MSCNLVANFFGGLALPTPALRERRSTLHRAMRPATTIVLGLLLLLIFGAAMIQFLVIAR
jgi:hypothetical protein